MTAPEFTLQERRRQLNDTDHAIGEKAAALAAVRRSEHLVRKVKALRAKVRELEADLARERRRGLRGLARRIKRRLG